MKIPTLDAIELRNNKTKQKRVYLLIEKKETGGKTANLKIIIIVLIFSSS